MNFIFAVKRFYRLTAFFCLVSGFVLPVTASAQKQSSTTASLNELGAEGATLAQRVGLWDVTETQWASPTAPPITTKGLVAERVLMGALLQEIIRDPNGTAQKAVKRTDLLSYTRLQGRWGYISFDTRAPVGLMPAWSAGRGDGSSIDLTFEPFAIPAPGAGVTGQLVLMEQVIRFEGLNQDVKDQYFTLADGSGTKWLRHRYTYVRRP